MTTTLRPLSAAELTDVSKAIDGVKQRAVDYDRNRRFYHAVDVFAWVQGRLGSGATNGRRAVLALKRYVQISRELGIDIMPALRAAFAGGPRIRNRESFAKPWERRSRASSIVYHVRKAAATRSSLGFAHR